MKTTRQTTLDILSAQPSRSMTVRGLSNVLAMYDVLGFGVEPMDIYSALIDEGKITIDTQDIVVLVEPTITGRVAHQLIAEKEAKE